MKPVKCENCDKDIMPGEFMWAVNVLNHTPGILDSFTFYRCRRCISLKMKRAKMESVEIPIWEYETQEPFGLTLHELLNGMGEKGWEVIGIYANKVIFKRVKGFMNHETETR